MIDVETLARFGCGSSARPRLESNGSGFNMAGYLSKHGLEVIRSKPWHSHPGGMVLELARCPFNTDHVNGSAAFTLLDGVPGFGCKHNGCHGKTIKDVFAAHPAELLIQVKGAAEWPDPAPLQAELPPVESFQLELLPKCMRARVRDVSERMQAPLDFAAAATLVALAGAVGRRAVIQPKAQDTGWRVTPNLWGGIIGRPGFMKSPSIQAIMQPLRMIQAGWFAEHREASAEHELDKERHAMEIAAWKNQFKKANRDAKSKPDRPDQPSAPKARRLIVGDATFEKVHELMESNSAGVLVLRDELTGWLAQLEKPGRELERAFSLEAWNGDGAFTVERVGRGTVHVEHTCMSLFGGIQPGKLRGYLADVLRDGPSDDGLIQRFQVLVWPDLPAGWELVDRMPDEQASREVAEVFYRLVQLSTADPLLFRFHPTAQELFFDWYSELQIKVRTADLHPALTSHLSKYAKLMPSLALLFELADQAKSKNAFSGRVDLDHTRQSAAYCEYLESHARRLYSCVTSPEMRAGAELARHIRRGELGQGGRFCLRDVYRPQWTGLGTPEVASAAVRVLLDWDWVREVNSSADRFGGRPSARYQINPKLRS